MDPFLEDPAVWEEFHHVFITECMYLLSDRLPDGYVAKIGERLEVVSVSDEAARQYVPDVTVAQDVTRPSYRPASAHSGVATLAAPVTIPAADSMEVREGYIEVLRLPGYELVTSVELLSPWNKFGEGVGEYRAKRRALVGRGVHVVEIDLLTRGRRSELARPLPKGDYYVLVFRGDRRPDVDVYAWGVRDRLPAVSVPLKPPAPDVLLDLAAVVSSAYERGRYARKVRYAMPVPASLGPDDAEWAAGVARGRAGAV